MSKEIYISSTPHETRLAIVENDNLAEIYYERENEYTLAGSIYNGRVTRVLPGMQSSFVDIGLERDAFLYITDFMEEAGDAADFEANANSGDAPRGRNGDRGGRDQQPRAAEPRSTEPSDAELFTQAVSGLDPARPVIEGERSDRGRRGGRNRGGRDRGQDRGQDRSGQPAQRDAVKQDEIRPEPVIAGNISIPDRPDEVGEGQPGADGSRRWRGRRGRRGNRGSGAPRPENGSPVAANESARVSTTGPVYDAYPEPDPSYDLPEVPAEEKFEVEAAATLPTPSEQAAFRERQPSGDRGSRGDRNDRGDRNRGGRDRGSSGQPRAPRGFAPSTDLYKVDKGETRYGVEPEIEAHIEPFILPGESLSKYRPGSAATEPASAAPAAPPVSDFVAQGWDGGLVLPGETLRPRTAPPAFRNDAPRDGGRGREGRDRNRGERNDRGFREPRQEFTPHPAAPLEPAEHTAPVAEAAAPTASEPASIPTYLTEPEHVPASHLVTPVDSTFVPPPPVPDPVELVVAHEVVEPPPMLPEPVAAAPAEPVAPQEYEPEEASASYRVDPVAPREFRQSAPVLDAPTSPEPETTEVEEFVHAVDVPVELTQELSPAAEVHGAPETHELTSISDTGDMHSEPEAYSHHELPAQEEAEPSSPIAHETAVVDSFATLPTPAQQIPSLPYFEPGSGLLEEEMLDDDEDILPSLHAQSNGHFDQLDQETLENAADLGTMIREMSIDQITRVEPALDEDEDEEDDFEEDFLEEDREFDAEESDLEEDEADSEAGDDVAYGHAETEDEESSDLAEPVGRFTDAAEAAPAPRSDTAREPRRDDRGRRDGRRGDRNRRPGGDRERSGGNGQRDHGRGRQSMQSTNLPAISDLLKPGQEILVQIAKEPIAKKGARITSHIALPGRFLVFMPTVSHTGVSRKIESDAERRRLKEILLSEKGDAQGGFIVRTAAAGASEDELRSDLRFLLNLWADIKARSESSKSPALIYHDLNLIERVLRDQVTDTFSAIWVDTETEYERVLRFLQRFQPSLIRRVKLYTKETPLFEQFGITDEINKALRSKVWLKSGGSIVINQTEALVAIDINTGKFVGKTARLEDTIVKTNLDSIPEIVRQIRLRDLGGIIIIDFIDMDERKNRNKVMAALEEELKSDRAPSKVLQFNDFGLVAITRKRVKQSLERTLSTTCNICQGTGMVKSPVTVCNDIYVEMRKMAKHLDRGDVMLRVHPEVVKQLKAPSTHWLQEMEEMVGKTILVKSDPGLHPEQFDIH
jgi:ribonuclease G